MIGRMRFTLGGKEVTAQLDDDLQWHVPDTTRLEDYLNFAFDATLDLSPASGTPGHRAFHEAVANLHAVVLVAPTVLQDTSEVIY